MVTVGPLSLQSLLWHEVLGDTFLEKARAFLVLGAKEMEL